MTWHTPPNKYGDDPKGVRPNYVYRCYATHGVLLYVGCSVSPVKRVESHRANAWWGDRIETVRNTVFPYREYALDVERQAIWSERPICNVKGRWIIADPRADWTLEEYRLLRHAVIQTANGVYGVETNKLLFRIDAEVGERFGVALINERVA